MKKTTLKGEDLSPQLPSSWGGGFHEEAHQSLKRFLGEHVWYMFPEKFNFPFDEGGEKIVVVDVENFSVNICYKVEGVVVTLQKNGGSYPSRYMYLEEKKEIHSLTPYKRKRKKTFFRIEKMDPEERKNIVDLLDPQYKNEKPWTIEVLGEEFVIMHCPPFSDMRTKVYNASQRRKQMEAIEKGGNAVIVSCKGMGVVRVPGGSLKELRTRFSKIILPCGTVLKPMSYGFGKNFGYSYIDSGEKINFQTFNYGDYEIVEGKVNEKNSTMTVLFGCRNGSADDFTKENV